MTTRARKPRRRAPGQQQQRAPAASAVRLTHPERVMDAASGVTKGDLMAYHELVAPLLMPYAENRPLALVRCPQGADRECFFQKQATPGFSATIRRATLFGNPTLHVREPRGLLELVQFNVVELHGWGARMEDIDRPDWIVFDLDPDAGLPFGRVVDAALELKQILEELALHPFVKTTGGKGLHVVVPLRPRLDWDRVKAFSRGIADALAQQQPRSYVASASKELRKGRIFVDWLRNGPGATAVLPYSPRARPGATVAMPVRWKDLAGLDPREFTVRNAARWIRSRRRDPWGDFFAQQQDLPERLDAVEI